MKEVIKGWIAREWNNKNRVWLYSLKPFKGLHGWQNDNIYSEARKLVFCHGLKPGQIKKAKMTVEVEK